MIEEQDNPVAQETPVQPVQSQAPQPVPSGPIKQPLWRRVLGSGGLLVACIVIGMGIGIIAAMTSQKPKPTTVTPTPIVTVTPSLVPQDLSPLATTSAYQALEQESKTVETQVRAFTAQDQTLAPPVINLPLGFSNN